MTEATQTAEPTKPTRKMKAAAKVAGTTSPAKSTGQSTKADAVVALLSRTKGATLDDLTTATGWQAHSVRGFISGTLKKKQGRTVTSEKSPRGRIYRITVRGAG